MSLASAVSRTPFGMERIVHLDVPHLREPGLAGQLAQDRFGEAEGAKPFAASGE